MCLAMLALSGCAGNGFSEFYDPVTKEYVTKRAAPPQGEPEVYAVASTSDQKFVDDMYTEGYLIIGTVDFTGPAQDPVANIMRQAKAVKAQVVTYSADHESTRSGVMPMTVPTTTTSYHSGMLSGGGSYSGTSTTYGTSTSYIPYNVNRYSYSAVFWAKRRPGGLGLYSIDVSKKKRQETGSNKGAEIDTVIKNSTAYHADLLVGDVIVALNDIQIQDSEHLYNITKQFYGKTVTMTVVRGGKTISKTFDVDPEYTDLPTAGAKTDAATDKAQTPQ